MPAPDELRAPIAQGRVKLEAAIRAAAQNWEDQIPGEDWSAKTVAEHVIPAEAFFATAVCSACGYPGIAMERGSYESAEDALAALATVSALSDGRLKHITPDDLENKHERMGSVADILTVAAAHLEEHAAQIIAVAKS
jgi:hypothetical protein